MNNSYQERMEKHLTQLVSSPHGGRFFIVRTRVDSMQSAHNFLLQWSKNFLLSVWPVLTKNNQAVAKNISILENNADIMFIGDKLEVGQSLKAEHFEEFWDFLKWSNFELTQRFVIISHGSTLSQLMTNKLLKILEEPWPNLNIFLLCEDSKPLLPTLEGRAVKLYPIPGTEVVKNPGSSEETKEAEQVIADFMQNKIPLHQILDWIKQHPQNEKEMFLHLAQLNIQERGDYRSKENFLRVLKEAQRGVIYHQSSTSTFFSLLSLLQH